jgi:hypothetical protein
MDVRLLIGILITSMCLLAYIRQLFNKHSDSTVHKQGVLNVAAKRYGTLIYPYALHSIPTILRQTGIQCSYDSDFNNVFLYFSQYQGRASEHTPFLKPPMLLELKAVFPSATNVQGSSLLTGGSRYISRVV